jgi:alkylhydroperoxidase family enzyme
MATLPDPVPNLDADGRALLEHMANARSHAEGRAHLGAVYSRMLNNPGVTGVVGALGEHLRFHGVLPDEVRELVILRFAARNRFGYIWSHHQRPASLAGIDEATIAELTAGGVPDTLSEGSQAALEIVDEVVAKRSIPAALQARFVAVHGDAGVVELVALCGLYSLMAMTTTSFDIPLESGFPAPPF